MAKRKVLAEGFLTLADIPPLGTSFTIEALRVYFPADHRGRERTALGLVLSDAEKPLEVNALSARQLWEDLGPDADKWIGAKITVAHLPQIDRGAYSKVLCVMGAERA